MMREDVATLISRTLTTDSIGNQIEQETPKQVFCRVDSISQNEFYQASQKGLKSELKITIWEFDYSGEMIVEYNAKRYSVYRTYRRNDERLELYLGVKAGV